MNLNQFPFQGTFRDYQQRVLDQASNYLDDGKIHIVAAPGSGKTILGLELITRLNQPTLILSPSITIKHQWMERFVKNFLADPTKESSYVSSDVLHLKPITSITYQALHAAMNRMLLEESDEVESEAEHIDFSNFDLIKQCLTFGVKTICLDEAHHLRSEWHKSLSNFIKALGKDIKIIALTATPPYDSSPSEWDKYIELCGDIDEEIFIPELVHQHTLAPHQDYIYFNYPSETETKLILDYRQHAFRVYEVLKQDPEYIEALKSIYQSYENDMERILDNPDVFISFLMLLADSGSIVPTKLIKNITNQKHLPKMTIPRLEQGLSFLLAHQDSNPSVLYVKQYLTKHNLIERNQLSLYYNAKIIKTIIGSSAKLNSIQTIVNAEYNVLGDALRMVILTDFIKKDQLNLIHTNEPLTTIGTTTIFESVRRALPKHPKMALLSGSLIILPISILSTIQNHPDWDASSYSTTPISTEFMTVSFSGSNKHKVKLITALFEQGAIEIIIGTASLLGEGWDSPAVNSLILASYVGSFMLSNQMRGRAIRIDQKQPNKVSNIWHLVSIEPDANENELERTSLATYDIGIHKNIIHSADYDTLKKRFDCFMGPAYHNDTIESGIDRIDIIKPPFHPKKFDHINQQMIELSKDREQVKTRWQTSIDQYDDYGVFERVEVEKPKVPRSASFYHYAREVLMIILMILMNTLFRVNIETANIQVLFYYLLYLVILSGLTYSTYVLFKYLSPLNYLKWIGVAILNTYKDEQIIESRTSKVRVQYDDFKIHTFIELSNANVHDQHVFTNAMKEVLSPIENPRYLIVQKGWFGLNYKISFNAPSLISNAGIGRNLEHHLSKVLDKYVLIYTRSIEGRKHLLKAKAKSFINKNDKKIRKARAVNRFSK